MKRLLEISGGLFRGFLGRGEFFSGFLDLLGCVRAGFLHANAVLRPVCLLLRLAGIADRVFDRLSRLFTLVPQILAGKRWRALIDADADPIRVAGAGTTESGRTSVAGGEPDAEIIRTGKSLAQFADAQQRLTAEPERARRAETFREGLWKLGDITRAFGVQRKPGDGMVLGDLVTQAEGFRRTNPQFLFLRREHHHLWRHVIDHLHIECGGLDTRTQAVPQHHQRLAGCVG